MTPAAEEPILDFSTHPFVVQTVRKDIRGRIFFSGLSLAAIGILLFLLFRDGFGLLDVLGLAVVALLVFHVVVTLLSLRAYHGHRPGLRVYSEGIVLPWRAKASLHLGRGNLLPFSRMAEIHVPADDGASDAPIRIVAAFSGETREFEIESMWVPDVEKLLDVLEGRVPIERTS